MVIRQNSVCLAKWQGHFPVSSTVFVDLFLHYLQKSPVFYGKAGLIIKRVEQNTLLPVTLNDFQLVWTWNCAILHTIYFNRG
jgi:hypothetical protein